MWVAPCYSHYLFQTHRELCFSLITELERLTPSFTRLVHCKDDSANAQMLLDVPRPRCNYLLTMANSREPQLWEVSTFRCVCLLVEKRVETTRPLLFPFIHCIFQHLPFS
jgi:hypothetical protein